MIGFANKNDIDQIVDLWQESFGDSRDYIINFVSMRFNANNCIVYRENGSIISMLFLLEGNLKANTELFSSFYVYAACTAIAHRGRGLMSQLLHKTFEYGIAENKDYICLVPSEESLFGYYSRFGFFSCFKRKDISFSRRQLNMLSENKSVVCNPSVEQITELRNEAFSNCDYFVWDKDAVEYAILENKSIGGKTVCAEINNKFVGYLIFTEANGKTFVKEFCALRGYTSSVVNLLESTSKSDEFIFTLPVNFPLTADDFIIRFNGMVKPLNIKGESLIGNVSNAYIGLTLE